MILPTDRPRFDLPVTPTVLLAAHPAAARLGTFAGVFAVMAAWERLAPRRTLEQPKGTRWLNNLAIIATDTLLVRLVLPGAALATALFATRRGWGVLPLLALPTPVRLLLTLAALDLTVYLQHVMLHAIPALWRLHRVHHADLDFDVTTGVRFHPLEILLSLLIKCAAIALLGASPAAVLLFELVLNASSMFTHGNVKLPARLDAILRWLLVTPEMHRVHHSLESDETNSNFGFNLSWWDRLLGTYRAATRTAQDRMTIGLADWRDPRQCDRLAGMLIMPFTVEARGPAIDRSTGKDDS
ncbi:MAG: sterol desaturase family protein [Pseudomonadota bacterium]|jgi:sterol desaturase/sphingolipid hydroxylase (fatty acid hydroxylase superfamily)|nr:sterol desaturase family protein [Pseudomonadota bacterium]